MPQHLSFMYRCLVAAIPVALIAFSLAWSGDTFAHEKWILTPAEVLEWNSKPKPIHYTEITTANVVILSVALLFTLGWVRLNQTGARELFPDLQARLSSYGHLASVILRVCLAWALISSAFALEPRLGNEIFQSPTLFAPDLELRFLHPDWGWLREAEIALGLMFLLGIWVRLAAVLLMALVLTAQVLFGQMMFAYLTAYLGVGIYLLMQGPGSHYLPIPTPAFAQRWADHLGAYPRERAQFILRLFAGLNFLYLGLYFKVLQPNLALGIIETYQVPILSAAPEAFVLIMAVVETLAGVSLIAGILMRPLSIILLVAFFFFASVLEETFTAHMLFYGIVLTFLFNGAGHWKWPVARDKAAHILILGGGFAAIRAAMKLERLRGMYSNIRVTLVHPHSEFVFQPLLPEVVGGSVQPGNVVNPIRRILHDTDIIQGRIETLELQNNRVVVERRLGKAMELEFDQLVLASQTAPDFDDLPGLVEHAVAVDSIGDALHLRQRILEQLAEAEHLPQGPERDRRLCFTVVGGGEHGCATAMEIRRLLNAAASAYPEVGKQEPRILLFEEAEAVGQAMPSSLKRLRDRDLEKNGIRLMSASRPDAITADGILFAGGRREPCATVVNTRYRNPRLELQGTDEKGFFRSDDLLRLDGHENTWVASAADLRYRRQFIDLSHLKAQGEQAGYNAWAASQGYPVRKYHAPRHVLQLINMGRHSVASFAGLRVSGFPAWFAARIGCLTALPGLERNLRVLVDWALDVPFRNDIAVLAPERTQRLSRAYYNTGDTVITEGEIGDTAFIIRSGEVEVLKGEEVIAKLGTGDCFGEIALLSDVPRTATVRCATPVELTVLARDQFTDLVGGFRMLGVALHHQSQQRLEDAAAEPQAA